MTHEQWLKYQLKVDQNQLRRAMQDNNKQRVQDLKQRVRKQRETLNRYINRQKFERGKA